MMMLLLACSSPLPEPRTSVLNREVVSVPLDSTYDVAIWLPEEASPGLPWLLVLDGGAGRIESELSDRAIVNGWAAPHAVVGIQNNDLRGRDYTPTPMEFEDDSGGYDDFMAWLNATFIPEVEAEFDIGGSAEQRAFHGHSYGGLATLSSLFAHQDQFSRFGASSPSVFWGDGVLFEREEQWSSASPLPARVYLSMGEHEITPMNPLFDEMVERLSTVDGIVVESDVHAGDDHFSAFEPAYAAQLPHLFPVEP